MSSYVAPTPKGLRLAIRDSNSWQHLHQRQCNNRLLNSMLGDLYTKGDSKMPTDTTKSAKDQSNSAPTLNNYAYYLALEGKNLKKRRR